MPLYNVFIVRDPRQDEIDREGYELFGMDDDEEHDLKYHLLDTRQKWMVFS